VEPAEIAIAWEWFCKYICCKTVAHWTVLAATQLRLHETVEHIATRGGRGKINISLLLQLHHAKTYGSSVICWVHRGYIMRPYMHNRTVL
jgi:hypothetical protein